MIKEAIGTAPTLDEARIMAIEQLDAPLDADVIVEVLEQATKKTLGLFGGSPAKVRAYYEIPEEEQPKQKQAKPVKNTPPKNDRKTEEKKQPPATPKKQKEKDSKKDNKVSETPVGKVVSSDNIPANYLKSILLCMGVSNVEIITSETDDEIFLEIVTGENYGNVIGRRGETLDALQYLTRLSISRVENEGRRITLNIGDYRSKRERTLKGLAKRQADRVLRYGKNSVLDPMNPYERRIIHTTVQEIDGVESHSIGEGDGRRVVITPIDGRSFNYQNRGRGKFDGKSRDSGRERRNTRAPYNPQQREPREPKSDIQGEFSFGKIEPQQKD